ncbi:hypothetical protein ILUMI_19351 [Ignelater luminosus]|uniref:Fucosyltransferase n=1 Tax=Ignelater luminosus TaxID=2038154 RepID=A0A8K0CMK8_IGNLU|nr:hypothetical protein ILUMI_19351 [Ignelater luminosus]
MPNREAIKNKTHLVAWFVSNCRTINRREELYRNLRRYVDIDVYGSCGKLKCPKEFHESSPRCYDLIERQYKFYLSFENSHCKDYVSEKLYRVLEKNIVPVVYGNNDYGKIAPPKSVIIADNYDSAEELADYLVFLDKNPVEYLKYFEWKKSYYVERNFNYTICKLCRMLNNASEPPKVYEDILTWWLGTNHSYCKLGDALPDISIPIQ